MLGIESKPLEGEVELGQVLGLQSIGIDYESLQRPINNTLSDFRLKVSDIFNSSESSEIFAIVVSVAEKPKELLPFITSGDIQGFVDKIHEIFSTARQRETTFYTSKDGKSVREFNFSKEGNLNLTRYPDDKYSVGGYR